jgi:hypothetical protein
MVRRARLPRTDRPSGQRGATTSKCCSGGAGSDRAHLAGLKTQRAADRRRVLDVAGADNRGGVIKRTTTRAKAQDCSLQGYTRLGRVLRERPPGRERRGAPAVDSVHPAAAAPMCRQTPPSNMPRGSVKPGAHGGGRTGERTCCGEPLEGARCQ